jgi:hypothetical protein
MNALILDRCLGNGYAFGLAAGLTRAGAAVTIGGPADWSAAGAVPLYRRGTPSGESRIRKGYEAAAGVVRAAHHGHCRPPDVLHVQWPTMADHPCEDGQGGFQRANDPYVAQPDPPASV